MAEVNSNDRNKVLSSKLLYLYFFCASYRTYNLKTQDILLIKTGKERLLYDQDLSFVPFLIFSRAYTPNAVPLKYNRLFYSYSTNFYPITRLNLETFRHASANAPIAQCTDTVLWNRNYLLRFRFRFRF